MLSNSNLEQPYKLFFLGAGDNRKASAYALLLLCCYPILLLLLLLPLLLSLFLVDFSQKIWYNHGIVGGDKARPKIDFIFVGELIFIEMVNYENAMKYIEQQEATNISYVKVGDNSKKLIVCFGSNEHSGFERKTSLMKLKYERNDFDVLYLRNQNKWYLGGLNGIGKNINHTIAFLKKEFSKYNNVITAGSSAGGYASILFGSVCNANTVIATKPQTDLEYSIANCLPTKTEFESDEMKCGAYEPTLASLGESKIISFESFNKYKNLRNVINSITKYYIHCEDTFHGFHGKHHCENLSDFENVYIDLLGVQNFL